MNAKTLKVRSTLGEKFWDWLQFSYEIDRLKDCLRTNATNGSRGVEYELFHPWFSKRVTQWLTKRGFQVSGEYRLKIKW